MTISSEGGYVRNIAMNDEGRRMNEYFLKPNVLGQSAIRFILLKLIAFRVAAVRRTIWAFGMAVGQLRCNVSRT